MVGVEENSEGVCMGGRGPVLVSRCGDIVNSLHCQPSSIGGVSVGRLTDEAMDTGLE